MLRGYGYAKDRNGARQDHVSWLRRANDIARLLGYGVPRIGRVLDCAANRATLLGAGSIDPESSLLYRVPLPDGLDGVRALRGLLSRSLGSLPSIRVTRATEWLQSM
jgi:hypothetical protein